MRRLAWIAFLALSAARAQSLVDSGGIAAVRAAFDNAASAPAFKCQITSIPAELNYGLRFETGFTATLPLGEIRGEGRRWEILLRVTPDGRPPVFLTASKELSDVARNTDTRGLTAKFAVGEGGYLVEALLEDNDARVCRSRWRIEAGPQGAGRGIRPSLGAGAVAALTGMPGFPAAAGEAKADRLTVLVHAAPFAPGHAKMDEDDVEALSSSLQSLLVYLPARSLRVVIFRLDQEAPLYQNDDFHSSDLEAAAKALDQAQLAVVDYKTLQRSRGAVDAAMKLIGGETARPDAPDAVVVLGAVAPLPEGESGALPKPGHSGRAQLFYLQYRQYAAVAPPALRGGPFPAPPNSNEPVGRNAGMTRDPPPIPRLDPVRLPDALALVTKALKGEIIGVYQPRELAGAIRRILARLGAPAR